MDAEFVEIGVLRAELALGINRLALLLFFG
jgi:hypothetical protein